jgi:hypothetical protein
VQATTSRVAALAGMVLFAALAVNGAPILIVSNLTETPAGVDGDVNAEGQSFITGGTATTLQDVVLELLGGNGAVDVALFSDNSGLPGSSLLSLGTLTPTGSGYADYTAAGTYALAADTTYWVVANDLGSSSWGFTASAAYSGTGTLGSLTNSQDGGADWLGPYAPTAENEPYLLEVDAGTTTATPEPSGLVLMLTGIGAMLFIKARVGIRGF